MTFRSSNSLPQITLAACLAWLIACGNPEVGPGGATDEVDAPSVEQPAVENPPEIVVPAMPEGRLRLGDPGTLPVLAEMNGLYYQAFEISERPYNGKRMEYHPGGFYKKETLFVEGALSRITEWDEGGQKRSSKCLPHGSAS